MCRAQVISVLDRFVCWYQRQIHDIIANWTIKPIIHLAIRLVGNRLLLIIFNVRCSILWCSQCFTSMASFQIGHRIRLSCALATNFLLTLHKQFCHPQIRSIHQFGTSTGMSIIQWNCGKSFSHTKCCSANRCSCCSGSWWCCICGRKSKFAALQLPVSCLLA